MNTVVVDPHVTASIIEHGKRKGLGSGFITGIKTEESIHVTNFIPYTREENEPLMQGAKKAFDNFRGGMANSAVLGWYSACCTRNPDGSENPMYQAWAMQLSAIFISTEREGNVEKNAIHLHCELPSLEMRGGGSVERPRISWRAYLKLVKRPTGEQDSNAPFPLPSLVVLKEMKVSISADGHEATNVVLHHVQNQVFYKGESPHPSSSLLNLDTVALPHSSKRSADTASLLAVQQRLMDLVEGKRQPTGGANSGDASASENREQIERTRKELSQMMQNDNAYSTSRDDVVTNRLKDALMIKCLVTLVKKSVTQIEILSTQYPDLINNANNNNNNNNNSTNNNNGNSRSIHSNGPHWRDPQVPSGPNFREVGGLMNRAEKL